MGLWQLNADTLARSRFVLSSFAETFAALKLLHAGVGAHPGEQVWLRDHLPGYRGLLAADPVSGVLVRAALGRAWIADFFCPTQTDQESFAETVARVRATPRPSPAPTSGSPSPARSPPPSTATTCPSGQRGSWSTSGRRPYGRTGRGAGGCWRRTWSRGRLR